MTRLWVRATQDASLAAGFRTLPGWRLFFDNTINACKLTERGNVVNRRCLSPCQLAALPARRSTQDGNVTESVVNGYTTTPSSTATTI